MYALPTAVYALILAGADANHADSNGQTPLLHAVLRYKAGEEQICLDIVKLLLMHGADPNNCAPGSLTPLMIATLSGSEEIVSVLLTYGADPNRCLMQSTALMPFGSTPFTIACEYSDHLIPVFLAHGSLHPTTILNCVRWLRDRPLEFAQMQDKLFGVGYIVSPDFYDQFAPTDASTSTTNA